MRLDQIKLKVSGRRVRHEKVNMEELVTKTDQEYMDFFEDFKWIPLSVFCEDKGIKVRGILARIKAVEALGVTVQNDAEGNPGVAVKVDDRGVKNLRRGRKLAVAHSQQHRSDEPQELTDLMQRSSRDLQVSAHSNTAT